MSKVMETAGARKGRAWSRMAVVACGGVAWVLASAEPGGAGDPEPQGKGLKALRLEYRTTGVFPGARPEERERSEARQRISVNEAGTALVYEELDASGQARRRLILRPDRREILEPLEGGKQYKEHAGDLTPIQDERRLTELNEIDSAKRLPPRERDEFFRENHLKPDGSRDVKVTHGKKAKFLGRDCEHVRVTENDRPIIDGLVTRDIPGSKRYYDLYRRLGAFSDEVLEELRAIEGIFVKGKLTVVTALRANELEVEATAIDEVTVPGDFFDVKGMTKVEDVPAEVPCAYCGKPVSTEHPGAKGLYGGEVKYFCSEACGDRYRLKQLGKEPSAKGGGDSFRLKQLGKQPSGKGTAPAPPGK